MTRQSSNSLAPGFRFHPTDEELVRYYLNRKVSGKPLRFNPISEIDIYKSEPWDLPDKSKLKSRDLEWYFFSALDRKYGNGSKTNRATEKGYWKTTGKDRAVKNGSQTVGMKKTLVYHFGRAPRGERTNWVMHEYRLADEESEKAGITQDAFVLCRVFKKSGTGPKNGEQYGAPFVEEEWEDDDEVGLFPGQEFFADEAGNTEGVHARSNEIDQNFDAGTGSANNSYQANFYPGESSNSVENAVEIDGYDVKAPSSFDGITFDPHQQDEQNLQEQFVMDAKSFGNDQYDDGLNPEDIEYLLNGQFFDASDNPLFGLEANDLSNDTQSDADFHVEDYLTFCDVDDDNFINHDPSELVATENPSAEAVFSKEPVNSGTELVPAISQLMDSHGKQETSTSKHQPVTKDAEPIKDMMNYSFMRKASSLLESFPAPPAFASEFPAKDALLKLGSPAQASSSVNVTAGFIKIGDMISSWSAMDWSFGKNGELNIILSIGLPQSNTSNFGPVSSIVSGKAPLTVSRSWLYLLFFWVLVLSVSIKVGIAVCVR